MRIRTIKPEFFTHEELFDLEKEFQLPIRVAFAGLWCAADREGRFKWEPRRLGVQILPYDNVDFSRVLDALMTRGYVEKYRVDGRDFGVIPSFVTHQVINNRERESDLPEPAQTLDCDATTTREPRVNHADTVEGKGREGNMEGNMEGKGKERSTESVCVDPPARKPDGRIPTVEEAQAAAVTAGVTPEEAVEWWHAREASDWKRTSNGTQMPVNLRAYISDMKTYVNNKRANIAEKRGGGNHPRNSATDPNRKDRYAKGFNDLDS
jgi:hypothetical protein